MTWSATLHEDALEYYEPYPGIHQLSGDTLEELVWHIQSFVLDSGLTYRVTPSPGNPSFPLTEYARLLGEHASVQGADPTRPADLLRAEVIGHSILMSYKGRDVPLQDEAQLEPAGPSVHRIELLNLTGGANGPTRFTYTFDLDRARQGDSRFDRLFRSMLETDRGVFLFVVEKFDHETSPIDFSWWAEHLMQRRGHGRMLRLFLAGDSREEDAFFIYVVPESDDVDQIEGEIPTINL